MSQGATEEEAAAIEWGADNSSLEPASPPVDPMIETMKKIEALLDMLIKSAQGRQYKLKDGMSKLDNLASSINNNLGYLDSNTQSYLRNLPEQYRKEAIASMLGNQTVVTGVDRTTASLAAQAMGMILTDMSGGDAFSVGGYIFVLGNTQDSSDLLGHEAIHGIQSIAAGGPVQFLEKYNTACIAPGITMDNVKAGEIEKRGTININLEKAYLGNSYEQAAYSFGPPNQMAESYLPNGRKQIIGNW